MKAHPDNLAGQPANNANQDVATGASAKRNTGSQIKMLTVRQASGILGISVATFWRRVADKTIPKPVKLGHSSRWPQCEILDVIETAKAARD